MKSIFFAGLIAAVAALPQYASSPSYGASGSGAAATTAIAVTGGSYPSAAATGVSTKKSACKKKHRTAHGSSYPTMTVGGTDGVEGPGATGTGHRSKKHKTACKKKGHKKTGSLGATMPAGTGSGSQAAYTGSPSTGGSGSSSGSSGSGSSSSGSSTGSSPSGSSSGSGSSSSSGSGGFSNSTTSASNSTSPASNGTASADNSGFLRGINIGNWLILEKWMDDGTVFTGPFSGAVDQWSFDSIDGAEAALQKHWSSWFTEDDVAKIASYGFNALRIPIGFWSFDNSGTPYKQGGAYWMDQAIGWARKHNMKVFVDMHGSPGSQNGQQHSGHQGAIQWQQGDNLQHSTNVLVQMAKKFGAANYSDVVWGLEMVNEPTANSPNNFGTSQSWAKSAYQAIYAALENKSLRVITHDSFMGPQKFIPIAQDLAKTLPVAADILGSSGQRTTFGVDQHDYQLYTDSDNSLNQAQHIKEACGWAANLKQSHAVMPTIVGEWSTLTNICVQSDGSTAPSSQNPGGSCTTSDPSQWSQALVQQVRRYVEAQLDVYEQNTDGYFLWSWKGPGGWGVEGPAKVGAFPSNVVTDRKYPGQCSGN